MAAEDIPRLRDVYTAVQRRDAEQLTKLLAHDITWTLPEVLPWGGTHHGQLGVMALNEIYDEHVDGRWADPDDFLDAGDRVVVLGRISGRARASGRPFEVPFAHVWGMSDGVPATFRSYLDTATVMAALEGGDG